MKKVFHVIILALSMALLFIVFGSSENTETDNKELPVNDVSIEEEKAEENNSEESNSEEDNFEEDNSSTEVQWGEETVGPMEFDAPISWKVSDSAFYAPHGPEDEYLGYHMFVGYNEYRTGNIKSFVDRDLGQYDDVDLDYIDVLGYDAARLQFEYIDDGETTFNIVYYIQIYPESGLGIISYEAPVSDPNLYMEDFERLFNSLSINESPQQEENDERTFVLNKSTGTFHKPSCYKVKEIENAENVVSTFEDMISQGYKGCEICNPK